MIWNKKHAKDEKTKLIPCLLLSSIQSKSAHKGFHTSPHSREKENYSMHEKTLSHRLNQSTFCLRRFLPPHTRRAALRHFLEEGNKCSTAHPQPPQENLTKNNFEKQQNKRTKELPEGGLNCVVALEMANGACLEESSEQLKEKENNNVVTPSR